MRRSGRNSGEWIVEILRRYPLPALVGLGVLLIGTILVDDQSPEAPPLAQPPAPSTITTAGQWLTGLASVRDGDSLQLNGTRIRLWGVDAPELHQTCLQDSQSWPCGQAAKAALTQLLAGQSVSCRAVNTDRYGRTVAECFVGKVNLNGWLVANGWALAYRRYSEKFVPAETQAKIAGLGLWQGEFTAPWSWRRQQRQK